MRFGIVRGVLDSRLDTGPLALSPNASDLTQGAFTVRLTLDQMDSVHFPRSGWRVGGRVFNSTSQLGADQEYTKWDADASAAYSLGNHTFNVGVKYGGKIGSDRIPRYELFQWGGFLQQSGYATGQFAGESLKYARAMYYHRILKGSIFEGAYGGASIEFGKVGSPLVPGNPDGWLTSASLFVAADSPLGPVYLAYGRAKDGNNSLYFYLGRPF